MDMEVQSQLLVVVAQSSAPGNHGHNWPNFFSSSDQNLHDIRKEKLQNRSLYIEDTN